MQLLKDFDKELLWCKWDKDLTSFIEHNDYYGSVTMLLSYWYIFSSSEPLGALVSLWYSHDASSSSFCRHHPSSTFSKISKATGLSKPNFILSLSWMRERKFVCGVWVTWPRWPPRQYMVKALKTSFSPEPKGQWPCGLVCSIGDSGLLWFVQMMTLGWSWPILQQGQIWSLMLLYGEKLLKSLLMEETYSKWPEWQKLYGKIKILNPGGCLPRGYIHV